MNDFNTFNEIIASLDANDGVWIELEAERFQNGPEGEYDRRIFANAVTMELYRTVYNRRTTCTDCLPVVGEARAVIIGYYPGLFRGVEA